MVNGVLDTIAKSAGAGRLSPQHRVDHRLEERAVLAERRRAAGLDRDQPAVFLAVDRPVDDLAVLVEVDREHGALLDAGQPERGLRNLGLDVVPGLFSPQVLVVAGEPSTSVTSSLLWPSRIWSSASSEIS